MQLNGFFFHMQILQVPIFQTASLWRALLPAENLNEEGSAFSACQLMFISKKWETGFDSEECPKLTATDQHSYWKHCFLVIPFQCIFLSFFYFAKLLLYNKINENGTFHLRPSLQILKCSFICKYLDSQPQWNSSSSNTSIKSNILLFFRKRKL